MEFELAGLFLALLLYVIWAMLTVRRKVELGLLPPGPRGLPVLGNIFQLGWASHASLAELARKHGPIMTIKLGMMRTIVVSSSDVAREMFKHHDTTLAGRKIYEAMKGYKGNEGSLVTSQYGPHVRMLRRLWISELFVTTRLEATKGLRRRCINQMLQYVEDASEGGKTAIDIGAYILVMTFNLIGNQIFSKDLLDPKSKRGAAFFYHAGEVMDLGGRPNVADFLPPLRWLDPQGIRRRTQFHVECALNIIGEFIKERIESELNKEGEEQMKKDILNVLLNYQRDDVEEHAMFATRTINTIVLEMFTAGTESIKATIEWAMAELLHNPHTMKKVQDELREMVHSSSEIKEEDIENLPYLKAVIKETLRLHPPLPLMIPHMAKDACKMLGYYIPKETQVLVNVWAIGREVNTWNNPLEFMPERFLELREVDYKGRHFEYLPFGSGRRMCPAMPLASRVLPMALASLLHSFDWVLPDGQKPEDMDMNERMGITLRRVVPLKVIPLPPKGAAFHT